MGQGVESVSAPGAEEGGQGHLVFGALLGAGAATDLAADHQMAQAPLGGVVVRRNAGLSHKDEQFFDEPLYAPAELALDRRWVVKEGAARFQQRFLQPQLGQTPLAPLGMGEGLRPSIEPPLYLGLEVDNFLS